MKIKIKKTGEIVNIAEYARITIDKYDSYGNPYGNPIEIKAEDIEFIQEVSKDEHWQDIRERAAIAAMQSLMNFLSPINYTKETIAKLAVEQANALIAELKK